MKLKVIVKKNGKVERYLDGTEYGTIALLDNIFTEASAHWIDQPDENDWRVYMTLGTHESPTVELPEKTTLSAEKVFAETAGAIYILQEWYDSLADSEYEGEIPIQG
ncbi:MAG: hypothetical protein DDT23_00883 [candidate division WS2 bacterium]|nr:hypothetical protein [Candidatus Lithacetigena glycinireducens]